QSEHQSAGFSSGGSIGANLMSNMSALPIGNESSSGHAEGATKSAVSEGGLIIRRQTEQSQDVSQLDRDAENANEGAIDPIFDKEKEQKRLRQAQLVSDIASQSLDIYNTYESTKATHSETDKSVKTGVNAVVRALQALAGGDIKAALAQGAAPYLAEKVKEITTNNADYSTLTETQKLNNLMAHAILGGVVAELSGGNGTAGAIGAATGELAAPAIALVLYGTSDSKALTTQQKENISALATLASGIAGGVSSDSTAGAATGAQAGKNAVENNYLSVEQSLSFDKELSECRKSGGDCQAIIDKWKAVSDKQSVETDQKLKDNPLEVQVIDKEVAQSGVEMTQRPGWLSNIGADVMSSEEAKAYVQQWNGQDLAKIDVNSTGWTKFAAFASDPENQTAVVSLGILGKDLLKLAKTTVSNIAQGGVSTGIKSMQTGLRNPQQVEQIKNDMMSGNYRFSAPEGRIAGYIDSKGNYYISEGNHRMVAAQEIYKKTGDKSYIDKLLQNGSWTQTKNAPVGAKPMPTRK
ncbi:VENN motif pre-toxin domain-containing protein, partial [Lonsdalea quercina]